MILKSSLVNDVIFNELCLGKVLDSSRKEYQRIIQYMKEKEIECNRHYPVPCHLQEAYKHLGYKKGDCPNAEYLAAHCATLPLFPEMTDEEVTRVIDAVNAY